MMHAEIAKQSVILSWITRTLDPAWLHWTLVVATWYIRILSGSFVSSPNVTQWCHTASNFVTIGTGDHLLLIRHQAITWASTHTKFYLQQQNFLKFEWNSFSRKYTWKCHLQNGGHTRKYWSHILEVHIEGGSLVWICNKNVHEHTV